MASLQLIRRLLPLQKKWNLFRNWTAIRRLLVFKSLPLHVERVIAKLPRNFSHFRLLIAAFLPVVVADSSQKLSNSDMDSLLKNADKHYEETDYKKIYNLLLPHKDDKNDEILWRLARALHEMSKYVKDTTEKEQLNDEAFKYIEEALTISENNYAVHKWMAILLDAVSACKGTKQRISESERCKFHIKKAAELNPQDATTFYMLGMWAFSFADLPWYQRKIAAVIFASPPTATYEEALEAFLHAEKIDPKFYSMNLLMLGKTYKKMGNMENAIRFLLQAKNYPLKTEDDKQAQKEAVDLLKDLGVDM